MMLIPRNDDLDHLFKTAASVDPTFSNLVTFLI